MGTMHPQHAPADCVDERFSLVHDPIGQGARHRGSGPHTSIPVTRRLIMELIALVHTRAACIYGVPGHNLAGGH